MRPNYKVLGVYLLGVFIGALDTNVLAPVLTLITKSFHVPFAWSAWTVTAYTVAYIASTVLAGALGDRFGRRRVFLIGIGLFGIASALAAVSQSFAMFVVARLIQGAGAGAVYPNAQAEGILQFPPEKRGAALGMFGAVFGLASILGPTVGGALGQYFGWPAVFVINLPIVLVVAVIARKLPESAPSRRATPDFAGALAFSGMMASALLLLTGGVQMRWIFAVAAAGLFAIFLIRQKSARTPFLDSKPLANRAGVAMMVGAALIGLDMSAAIYVPALTQKSLGFSVLDSGLALLPAAFSGAVLSGVGGVLVDKMGPRRILSIGLYFGAAGGLLLAWPPLTMVRFILAMIASGTGTAFTMGAPLNKLALGLYRDDQAGEALSLVALFRAVGLAAGPVILTAAHSVYGFTGMFGAVFVASVVGALAFLLVPDVRPTVSRPVAESGH